VPCADSRAEMDNRTVVRAVFRPTHPETLKPGMSAFIGVEALFMAAFEITSGPYAGQREMWVTERRESGYWTFGSEPFAGWVPEEDLDVLEIVEKDDDRGTENRS
jgi:hypothetical protein